MCKVKLRTEADCYGISRLISKKLRLPFTPISYSPWTHGWIFAKLKNKFSKKKKFTRFVKGKLTFDKKGYVQFEVFEGQESYKIKPFVKSNAWGVFKDGFSVFNKGNLIEVYSASGLNEFLIN